MVAGVVRCGFLSPDETIRVGKCCTKTEELPKKLVEKQPELPNRRRSAILHGNARICKRSEEKTGVVVRSFSTIALVYKAY